MNFIVSIGLETHVQLKTASKMFCGFKTSFADAPNTNVCPICLGYPGALPLMNREAVKLTVLSGLMLGCKISANCKFDRKNYFYPDASKNYQISQYDQPLCLGGAVEIQTPAGPKTINLTRIHLEEDVAKNTHHPLCSGVDFNRAGTPLMEIVSEPEMSSADEAVAYLRALRQILVYTGVSDCNLEEGNMRCDVNVSIRPAGTDKLGTKVEIKNMNSFSHIQDALRYEIARQERALVGGGAVVQETRRYEPETGETASMRSKENAHDYRYFPEPDIPPFIVEDELIESLKRELPKLPEQIISELTNLGVETKYAKILVNNDIFVKNITAYQKAAIDLNKLASLLVNKKLTFVDDPELLHQQYLELQKVGNTNIDELKTIVEKIIADNPSIVADYKKGKTNVAGFFVGQAMKETKGQADPRTLNTIVQNLLNE